MWIDPTSRELSRISVTAEQTITNVTPVPLTSYSLPITTPGGDFRIRARLRCKQNNANIFNASIQLFELADLVNAIVGENVPLSATITNRFTIDLEAYITGLAAGLNKTYLLYGNTNLAAGSFIIQQSGATTNRGFMVAERV